jgi:glycosyltransferase involved in cell wall biosynthesis
MWITLIFFGTAALFLTMTLFTLWHLQWMRRLPAIDTLRQLSPRRRCSVVIAARDEKRRIEQTIRSLLAQSGVELEIIVVDDRSTDSTGEILQRLASEDARVQVKRVEALPAGWLGKCHACHIGASAATSEWILFTDADCWLKSDVTDRALRVAEREQADHITLASGIAVKTRGLVASHLVFLLGNANWFSETNRDTKKKFLGFGAFNLVRTQAYREAGGYEALRLTVVDDMKLGLLLQRAGKRTRGFLGGDDVEAHWGDSAFSIIKILEKNYFAALEYRTSLVVVGASAMIFFSVVVTLGLFSGTPAGFAAALSPLSLIIPGVLISKRQRWCQAGALLIPLMFPIYFYAMLNSTVRALRHGGIRWRETFYSLEELRAGNVK